MTAISYPPATPFEVPNNHPNVYAHHWLDSVLDELDWGSEVDYRWIDRQIETLSAKLSQQHPNEQIAVLKACLERMHWHREQRSSEGGPSVDYYIGSVLYGVACKLYRWQLPCSEDDICQILQLSRHTCGHGSDVTPPFEIAIEYARACGLTTELLSALKDFMNGLKGVSSAQASHLKRKGGLLFVLDADSTTRKQRCWSDRFTAGLQSMPREEAAKWRRLVLSMTVNDVYVLPKAWRREASRFVEKLSPPIVVQRLSSWWPDPKEKIVWPIQTGGSHLLKYFIWLLSLTAATGELESQGIELVCRLSELDWKPRERAQKVVIAAASHLVSLAPEVSWPALQRIAQWSESAPDGTKGSKIRELLRTYCHDHRLELPISVSPKMDTGQAKD